MFNLSLDVKIILEYYRELRRAGELEIFRSTVMCDKIVKALGLTSGISCSFWAQFPRLLDTLRDIASCNKVHSGRLTLFSMSPELNVRESLGTRDDLQQKFDVFL